MYLKLLTQALRKQLPKLGATREEPDPMVICKFFYPDFHWTWFALEFDGEDTCFGLVDGDVAELGTFSLSELKRTRGMMGLRLERDCLFEPCRLSAVKAQIPAYRLLC